MSYDYGFETSMEAEQAVLAFAGIFLSVMGVALIFSLVCYIFEAIGVYTIAKRRSIKSPWLAWIPIGNVWLWGCIADQYQYVARGQSKNRRMIILILSLASFVLSSMTASRAAGTMAELVMYADYMTEAEINALMTSMLASGAGSMFGSIVSIVLMVFQYIALYDLFNSCDPNNSTMFLVLSIIFGIARPFFIFADRNKDLGMPATKQEPQPYTPQDPWMNQ